MEKSQNGREQQMTAKGSLKKKNLSQNVDVTKIEVEMSNNVTKF